MTRVSMPAFRTPIALLCALVLCVSCGRKAKDDQDQDPRNGDSGCFSDTVEAEFDAGCGEGESTVRSDLPHDDEFKTAMFERQFQLAHAEYKAQRLDAAYDAVTRALGFRPESEVALNLRRDIMALRAGSLGRHRRHARRCGRSVRSSTGANKRFVFRSCSMKPRRPRPPAISMRPAARWSGRCSLPRPANAFRRGGGDTELASLGGTARQAMDELNDAMRNARARKLEQDTNDALAAESKLEERAMFEARARRGDAAQRRDRRVQR